MLFFMKFSGTCKSLRRQLISRDFLYEQGRTIMSIPDKEAVFVWREKTAEDFYWLDDKTETEGLGTNPDLWRQWKRMNPLSHKCVCQFQSSITNDQASSKLGRLKQPLISWIFCRKWLVLSTGGQLFWIQQGSLCTAVICWLPFLCDGQGGLTHSGSACSERAHFSFLLHILLFSCKPSWISYMTILKQGLKEQM